MSRFTMLLMLLVPFRIYAQNAGPVHSAMGSGGAALSGVWAIQSNPAGLAELESAAAAASFEQSILEDPVVTQSVVFATPAFGAVAAIGIESYGFSAFRKLAGGLALAKRYGSLNVSILARYHQTVVPVYGTASNYSADVGVQYRLNDRIRFASQVSNIGGRDVRPKLILAIAYHPSPEVTLIADMANELSRGMIGKIGAQYHAFQMLSLRAGFSLNPFKQFAGFGLRYRHFTFDCAVSAHHNLGYTPQIGISYAF